MILLLIIVVLLLSGGVKVEWHHPTDVQRCYHIIANEWRCIWIPTEGDSNDKHVERH